MTPPPPAWVGQILRALSRAQSAGISGELVVRWEIKRGQVVRAVLYPPAEVLAQPNRPAPLDEGGTLTAT